MPAPAPNVDHDILADRQPVLRKALSRLPDELLDPLVYALRAHRDELEPNRLYAGRDGGGCAVGVMLQELFPAAHSPSRLAFWRRRGRSIYQENERLAKEFPRLAHIEGVFDSTHARVAARYPQFTCREVAREVGIWMADEAQAELDERQARAREGVYFPSEWMDETPAPAAPACTSPRARERTRALAGV